MYIYIYVSVYNVIICNIEIKHLQLPTYLIKSYKCLILYFGIYRNAEFYMNILYLYFIDTFIKYCQKMLHKNIGL